MEHLRFTSSICRKSRRLLCVRLAFHGRDHLSPYPRPTLSTRSYAAATRPQAKLPIRRWVLGSILICMFTAFSTYRYQKPLRETMPSKDLHVPEDVSDRYHQTASRFDGQVGMSETLMGLGWLRSYLTRKADGNVLEVGAGTGRNSAYYDLKKCKSITMLDQSQEMLDIARNKFKCMRSKQSLMGSLSLGNSTDCSTVAHPSYKACRFVAQSAHEPILSPPNGFDTIIQTMSLCSISDPVSLLRHLSTLVNSDSGKILLLEHGRSHYEWLNQLLDESAAAHANKYGCWWNKDIDNILKQSGLEVVRVRRYHFGTTWWVELKPQKG